MKINKNIKIIVIIIFIIVLVWITYNKYLNINLELFADNLENIDLMVNK